MKKMKIGEKEKGLLSGGAIINLNDYSLEVSSNETDDTSDFVLRLWKKNNKGMPEDVEALIKFDISTLGFIMELIPKQYRDGMGVK